MFVYRIDVRSWTHSGLWVDARRDSVHRHTQAFTVFEIHAVVPEHVAETEKKHFTRWKQKIFHLYLHLKVLFSYIWIN